MDLPDAARDRDRGLPLEPDPPSVRRLRPSGLCRDPEHDRSLCVFVTSQESDARPSPVASPGMARSTTPAHTGVTASTTVDVGGAVPLHKMVENRHLQQNLCSRGQSQCIRVPGTAIVSPVAGYSKVSLGAGYSKVSLGAGYS